MKASKQSRQRQSSSESISTDESFTPRHVQHSSSSPDSLNSKSCSSPSLSMSMSSQCSCSLNRSHLRQSSASSDWKSSSSSSSSSSSLPELGHHHHLHNSQLGGCYDGPTASERSSNNNKVPNLR